MMIIIVSAVPRLLGTDEDPAILINMQNKPKRLFRVCIASNLSVSKKSGIKIDKKNKHIMR